MSSLDVLQKMQLRRSIVEKVRAGVRLVDSAHRICRQPDRGGAAGAETEGRSRREAGLAMQIDTGKQRRFAFAQFTRADGQRSGCRADE